MVEVEEEVLFVTAEAVVLYEGEDGLDRSSPSRCGSCRSRGSFSQEALLHPLASSVPSSGVPSTIGRPGKPRDPWRNGCSLSHGACTRLSSDPSRDTPAEWKPNMSCTSCGVTSEEDSSVDDGPNVDDAAVDNEGLRSRLNGCRRGGSTAPGKDRCRAVA